MDTQNQKLNIALFANDKEGNANRPDYKGQITFNVSAWKRTSKNGNEYLSINLEQVFPKKESAAKVTPFGDPIEDDGLL